jgi:hypothetical protein
VARQSTSTSNRLLPLRVGWSGVGARGSQGMRVDVAHAREEEVQPLLVRRRQSAHLWGGLVVLEVGADKGLLGPAMDFGRSREL